MLFYENEVHWMNISIQRKIQLIEELINEFRNATYSRGKKQELIDQARAKLQFVKPESTQEIINTIQSRAGVRVLSSNAAQQLMDEINRFESFKARALSQFSGLMTEMNLLQEFSEPEVSAVVQNKIIKDKVFIVHGHDNALKIEVARFIETLGLKAIILHEQLNRGRTIIEKFESFSDVGFAIILYTPCDFGRASSSQEEQPRARQNVIFEHGYFVSKLGRENVIALNKGNVEFPNDLSGLIYTSYEQNYWQRDIARELSESGYEIDFSKI